MANFYIRSNSLPSESHPVINDVEDHLRRLKSSEGASTSANLASLADFHKDVDNLIQMPSIQQALSAEVSDKWTSELLEESLGLVDLCGFAREILSLSMGSIQELQSTIRRNRGETASADDINAYMTSRKKIHKMIIKFIKNFKSFEKRRTPLLCEDSDLRAVLEMLKETANFDFSTLRTVLMFLSGEEGSSRKRSWPLLSIFTQTSRVKRIGVAEEKNFLMQLKSSEIAIQELDKELEAYYRTLVKARVTLLNALSH